MKSEEQLRRTWPWSRFPLRSESLGWTGWVCSGRTMFLVRDAVLWPEALVIVGDLIHNQPSGQSSPDRATCVGPRFWVSWDGGEEIGAAYVQDVDFETLRAESPNSGHPVRHTFGSAGMGELIVSPAPLRGVATIRFDWPAGGLPGQVLSFRLPRPKRAPDPTDSRIEIVTGSRGGDLPADGE